MSPIEIPALPIPKVALVTGASSGIGGATAARLAALGTSVVVGYHSRGAEAEALAAGLAGGGHLALRIAINEPESIAAAAAAVQARFGRLDALVNSGGATTPVPANDLDGLTDEIFDRTVTTNLRGPFAMVRAFRPLLERGSDAAVVNISSIAARTGLGSSLAYLAAKAGLDALTVALAKVLAPRIRVFSVSPAGVDTDFVPGRSREQLQKTAERLPLAHLTTPDDVARAVVACIVNLTSSTGIVVPVDEGRHL
jgi:3-oxoacyl-[acyl-carrier protein] reductase